MPGEDGGDGPPSTAAAAQDPAPAAEDPSPPPSPPQKAPPGPADRRSDESDSTPTTMPMSPTSRAGPYQEQGGAPQQGGPNPPTMGYYLYQQGSPPPSSPGGLGGYDIHTMLQQQQQQVMGSPYAASQGYPGAGLPPPPPLSPAHMGTGGSGGTAQMAAGVQMVSPLLSPISYPANQFDQAAVGGDASGPALSYLPAQVVSNPPYGGLYQGYGGSSPTTSPTKWTGGSQPGQTPALPQIQGYPVQYPPTHFNNLARADSNPRANSQNFGDEMMLQSSQGSQYPQRLVAGAPGPQAYWGGNASRYGTEAIGRSGGYQGGRYGGYPGGATYYAATTPGPPIQTTPSNKGPDGANLFIFHIPNHFTNLDMYNLFCTHGTLLSVRIMVEKDTGRSRGFGFVSYDSPESAAMAIKELNGFVIGNKRLKVQHKQIRHGEQGPGGQQPPMMMMKQQDHELYSESPYSSPYAPVTEEGEEEIVHPGPSDDTREGTEPAELQLEDGTDAAAPVDDSGLSHGEPVLASLVLGPNSASTNSPASPLGQFDSLRSALPEEVN